MQYNYVRYILLTVFIFLLYPLQAQQGMADSLWSLLKKGSLSQKDHVDVLNELSYTLYDTEDSTALALSIESLSRARKIKYKAGERYALTLIGLGYYNYSEYEKALKSLRASRNIILDEKPELAGYNLALIGSINRDYGYYDSALYYYNLAIKTIGEDGDGYYLGAAYRSMASVKVLLWQNQEALEILQKAEKVALSNPKDRYVILNIWSQYGKVYQNLLDYEKADHYFSMMCTEATQGVDYYHITQCYLNKADLEFRLGNLAKALDYSFDALKVSDQHAYAPLRAEVYSKIGSIYQVYSQFDIAYEYIIEALKITESVGLRYETAERYSDLAWILKDQSNFTQAHHYIDKAQKLREDIGDQHGIAGCHNYRGLIFFQEKKYDMAIAELEKSLTIRQGIGHTQGVAASLFNLSLVFEAQGLLRKALDYQLRVVEIEEKIENKLDLGISYNSLAALYMKFGDLAKAEQFLQRAKIFSLQTGSKILLRNNYRLYAELYKLKGNYKAAFEHQERFQQLNDSIYSEGSAVKLAEMEALYQVEQKERQIELLNAEKQLQVNQLELQKSQINFQNIVIISGIAVFLLVLILAIKTYQYNRTMVKTHHEISGQKEKIQMQALELTNANKALQQLNNELLEKTEEIEAQSEELRNTNEMIIEINRDLDSIVTKRTAQLNEAYKELDTFFYRSSHDFRRPLTTFMGLAEVAKVTLKDQNALELFAKVNETARSLDKMLIKLQSISDVGAQQLVFKEVLIREIFLSVCDTFQDEIHKRGFRVLCEVNMNSAFVSYPAMIRIILENMLENSIQFSILSNPFVQLTATQEEDNCVMVIEDNGQGIPQEYREKIFEMYFRASDKSKGNGLGLYIVKKAVEKLGGGIVIDPSVNIGSRFTITIPMAHDEFLRRI